MGPFSFGTMGQMTDSILLWLQAPHRWGHTRECLNCMFKFHITTSSILTQTSVRVYQLSSLLEHYLQNACSIRWLNPAAPKILGALGLGVSNRNSEIFLQIFIMTCFEITYQKQLSILCSPAFVFVFRLKLFPFIMSLFYSDSKISFYSKASIL